MFIYGSQKAVPDREIDTPYGVVSKDERDSRELSVMEVVDPEAIIARPDAVEVGGSRQCLTVFEHSACMQSKSVLTHRHGFLECVSNGNAAGKIGKAHAKDPFVLVDQSEVEELSVVAMANLLGGISI